MSLEIELLTYDQIIDDRFDKCLPGKALKEFKDSEVTDECDFTNLRFYYLKDYVSKDSKNLLQDLKAIESEYLPFNINKINLSHEFIDFLFEFPICVILKGTYITHSSQIERFYRRNEGELQFNKEACFWLKGYKVGHKKFRGGWYTINDSDYGGPKFGLNIIFRFDKTASVLFIPPIYKKLFLQGDKNYFDNNYYPDNCKDIEEYNENLESRKIDLQEILDREPFYSVYTFLETRISFKTFTIINRIVDRINMLKNEIVFEKYTKEKLNEIDEIVNNLKIYIRDNFQEEIEYIQNKKLEIQEEMDEIKEEMGNIEKQKTNFQSLKHYTNDRGFSGSHISEGVKNWFEKGYEKITRNYESYADQLANKLSLLGFYGYNSCDECEVYVSHNLKGVIEGPVEITLNKEIFFELTYKDDLLTTSKKEKIFGQVLKTIFDECLPNGGKIFLKEINDTERSKYDTNWLVIKPL